MEDATELDLDPDDGAEYAGVIVGPTEPGEWVLASYAASQLEVTTQTIRNWISQGKITGTKHNARWWVRKDTLMEWCTKHYGTGEEQ